MARDPNKSSRGPQNTLGDGGLDFDSLGRMARRVSGQQAERYKREGIYRERLSDAEESLASGASFGVNEMAAMARDQRNLNSIESNIDISQRSQIERVSNLARNQINRSFSSGSVNGQSAQFARSSAGQSAGFGMMGQSYRELEEQNAYARRSIAHIGRNAINVSEGLINEHGDIDPGKQSTLQKLEARRSMLTNTIGSTEVAMKMHRAMGTDPYSRDANLMKAIGAAQQTQDAASLARDVRGGSYQINRDGKQVDISSSNINKELASELQNLTRAFKEMEQVTDKTSTAFAKARDKAEESAKNIETHKQAQAAAGGGWGASVAQWGSAISGGFQAMAGATQMIGVNQPMQQVANIAGFANIENQKYDMYRKAAAGDVQSQMLLAQWGGAGAFGKRIHTNQSIVLSEQLAGSAAQVAAGYGQYSEGLAEKGNPLTYAAGTAPLATQGMLQGGLNMAGGFAQGAVSTMDLSRGTTANAARIQATQSAMEATRALTYVQAQQLQGFRDFGVGTGITARGMGSRGAGFFSGAVSDSNLAAMESARIGPEQFNEMAAQGVNQMGSMFNKAQIFAARGMERSGYGTMQENMTRMGALAGAGSNDPRTSLGTVLEAAVSKGLDSSKAMSAMVDHTAAMASTSVGRAMGMDTTAASSAMLASMVSGNAPNKEAALERAASLQERIKDIGTNTSASFAGMLATARIARGTGLGSLQAISAQKIDTETLISMKNMSEADRHRALLGRGIDSSGKDSAGLVNKLLDYRAATVGEEGGVGLVARTSKERQSMLDKIKANPNVKFSQLSDAEIKSLGLQAGVGNSFKTAEELFNAEKQGYAANPTNVKGIGAAAALGQPQSKELAMADNMATQGMKQLAQAAKEAAASVGGAVQAFKALGNLAKEVEGIGDRGGERQFGKAGADAAGTFGGSVKNFGDDVKMFGDAVRILNIKAGLYDNDDAAGNREMNKAKQVPRTRSGSGSRSNSTGNQ